MRTLVGPGIILVIGFPIFSFAASLSDQAKKSFVIGAVPVCVQEQRQEPTNKYMTDAQLTEYCRCTSVEVAETLSQEDVGRFLQTKSNTHIQTRLEAAGYSCGQKLLKKWGYLK